MSTRKNENAGGLYIEPLLTRPQRVAIVALGASSRSFLQEQMGNSGMDRPFDEVWTLNRGIRSFPHDKLFAMDDLRWLAKKSKGYGEFLKQHDKPIITSTVYPEFKNAVRYPYQEVLADIQDDIFNVNTVAYMVAYAIYTRVQELTIYGADFFYPDSGDKSESGGQAVAYLLGMFKSIGMVHRLPGTTTLLYANKVQEIRPGVMGRPPYGFHRIDQMKKEKAENERLKAEQKRSLK
jgi:hypothetical protein|tara:strand:- start:64 stop:771 length:708 start_codon:yes stop_codon:yes gene_type:complete